MTDTRKRFGALVLHYFRHPGSRTLLIKWRDRREWRWNISWSLSLTFERTTRTRLVVNLKPESAPSPDVLRAAMAAVEKAEAV